MQTDSAPGSRGTVTLIGAGRLGLCTALCLEHAGYSVCAVDINANYCEQVNARTFQSDEPHVTDMLRQCTALTATTDLARGVQHSSLLLICVDTPSGGTDDAAYDHSKLSSVLQALNRLRVRDATIVVQCTVQPGYLDDVGTYLLRDCPGSTSLSYNPEFIAQGAIIAGFRNPDILLIGEGSPAAGDRIQALYEGVVLSKPKVCRMSRRSAEIAKLALNCYVTMKITFANMIADIAARSGPDTDVDAADILAAVGADRRVGHRCLGPGYGFGGPCFPRDNRALAWYAESIGAQPLLPRATDAYNRVHAQEMAQVMLDQQLDQYVFRDVCYKERCPVPIIEQSQKLAVAEIIARAGRPVVIRDREVVVAAVQRRYGRLFQYQVEQ